MSLLVSITACKELRGHHSATTKSKNLKNWKINHSSYNGQRNDVTEQTPTPKFGGTNKKIQQIITYLIRNSRAINLQESVPGRKTKTVIYEMLEAQCGSAWVKSSRATNPRRVPTFLWILPLGFNQILTVNIWGKSLHVSSKEKGKGNSL